MSQTVISRKGAGIQYILLAVFRLGVSIQAQGFTES